MKLNLSYVFSAPAMLRLVPTKYARRNPEIHKEMTRVISEGVERVRLRCQAVINDDSMKTSILYNGYTEDRYGPWINENDRYGLNNVYVDSGGLQAVTRGLKIDDNFKHKIYETQKHGDYGFCFDEIPLRLKDGVDPEKGNHRALTDSKLFDPSGFKTCAEKTANNLKDQTSAFLGSKTQAFYILQGNKMKEMVDWYEAGVKVLPKENWEAVRGLAPADTCMGSGPLESIEMLVACHEIIQRHGPQKHIHLLGVGSSSRLMPAVFMKQAGFLDPEIELSFDSSTASMAYVMGNFLDSDGTRVNRHRKLTEIMFGRFYDDMGDLLMQLSPTITKEWYLDYVMTHYKSLADTINNCPEAHESAIRTSIPLVCIWQNIGFFKQLDNTMKCEETRVQGIGFLSEVKNMDDYRHWYSQFQHHIKSRRIDRKIQNTLDNMFG